MLAILRKLKDQITIFLQSFLVPLPWSACPAENETTVDRFRECQVITITITIVIANYHDPDADSQDPNHIIDNW